MGAVRTTFAMVAACIVRRKQLLDRGLEDPYATRSIGSRSGISTVSAPPDKVILFTLNYHIQPSGLAQAVRRPQERFFHGRVANQMRVADERKDSAGVRASQRPARHESLTTPNYSYPPATYVTLQGCVILAAH